MKQLIAKKPLRYAGRRYAVGSRFSATDVDARTLTVTGLAGLADEDVPAKRKYRRRDMRAEV